MTAAREKDSSDFDLEQFIDLFDTALASNNPAVKRALKNLMMIATLVDSDLTPEQRIKGPLRRVVDDINNLTRRISQLEQEKSFTRTYGSGGSGGGTVTTPWQVGPTWTTGTGIGPNWPPGTIIGQGGVGGSSGTYTLTSTTAVDDQYLSDQTMKADTLTSQKIQSMLDMLDRFDKK